MWKRMLESRWFYAVAAACMLAAFFAWQVEVRTDRRASGESSQITELHQREDLNILFVLIDTLRADRLGAYGYERDTSPNIDALAATGLRFGRHMSQSSWTKCSMASLWTGLYPVRTGVTRSPQALPEGAKMPAEILREAGFRTYALWRNGWVAPKFGFSQGFEVYYSPRSRGVPPSVRREKPNLSMTGTDQDVARSAVEFLRSHEDEKWFLYLHLMDVHQYIYDEETALFGTTYSDIYDNSIRWVDRILGSLVHELDVRGLREKTLLVLAADHGEAFGEHGREGHARDVYGEVITTPFILSFPFRLEGGLVVDAPTANVDVWPTLLELLGLPPLEDPDGRSRVPEIRAAAAGAPPPADDTPRFAHLDQNWARLDQDPRPIVAVADGDYRLVIRPTVDGGELFDRSVDVREQRDLGRQRPEDLARMRALAQAYLERPPAPWGAAAPDISLDPEEIEELRALGYGVQ